MANPPLDPVTWECRECDGMGIDPKYTRRMEKRQDQL
jgi:hypothetical protein